MAQVFFATNRIWDDGRFGITAAPGNALRLGVAQVPAGAEGTRLPGCSFTATGDDDFVAANGSCDAVLRGYLATVKAAGAAPLISIHGFQYRFEEAVTRTAEIAAMFEASSPRVRLVPFLVTWPSSGLLTRAAYPEDRENAKRSGLAIARLLVQLGKHGLAARDAVLLVHSSGAWALQHAVQALLALTDHRPPRLFRDAILAAADVGADALTNPGSLAPLAAMADRVTAILNRGDAVLNDLSAIGNQEGPRLGSHGPAAAPPLPANVRVLDVSGLVNPVPQAPVPHTDVAWNAIGHQYYRNEAAVRDAMALLLASPDWPAPPWRRGVVQREFGAREIAHHWYTTPAPAAVQPVANAGG